MEFHSSKLINSKFWVKETSRGKRYLKEVHANCNPKVLRKICQSGSMCRFYSAKLSHLDVKYNSLSFGDPNWVIPIGEETLGP